MSRDIEDTLGLFGLIDPVRIEGVPGQELAMDRVHPDVSVIHEQDHPLVLMGMAYAQVPKLSCVAKALPPISETPHSRSLKFPS